MKKFALIILALIMVVACMPVTYAAEETQYYYGDINKDTAINAKDANLLKRVIAGSLIFESGSFEYTAADVDCDGTLSAKDSNLIKKIIKGDLAPEPVLPKEPEEPEETERTEPLAPDFTVYDKNGNTVHLSDYIGKPVVLNFWASWCYPCKKEMPDFNEKYLEMGDEVHFLMVNVTGYDTIKDADAYINSAGFTFPVLYDIDLSAVDAFDVSAYPTTFFIDADGYLMAYAIGTLSAAALQQGIDLIR